MQRSNREGRWRGLSCLLLLVVGLILSGHLLAACGGSSSSSESTSSETTETAEAGEKRELEGTEGSDPETTVYAEGVPTLKELYEGSNEPAPTTGPAAASSKNVAFITCSTQPVGCAYPAESFVEAAKVLGWKARIYDGKLNVNNGYATAFHAAIASNPDAIVMFGIACEEVKTSLEEAKKANIPVVESITEDCSGSEPNGPKLYSVENQFNQDALSAAEFYERFGENQAAYVVDKTEGKAKVILTEWVGSQGRRVGTGWKTVFEKCAECEILENVEWEAAEQAPNGPLEQRFKTALTKFPEANAAIIAYDSMATFGGLAKAIVDAGRQSDMLVVSGEGFAETLQLMEEGKGISAEGGAWDNKWAGWELADELNRYFNGEPSVPQGLGLDVIDLEHNLPPEGKTYEADIDYVKAYEEIGSGKKEGK
jgi:ribose transport system substrate-binding protein